MRMMDYVKFGFGFFIGYETAKTLNEIVGEIYPVIKAKFKKGYC